MKQITPLRVVSKFEGSGKLWTITNGAKKGENVEILDNFEKSALKLKGQKIARCVKYWREN